MNKSMSQTSFSSVVSESSFNAFNVLSNLKRSNEQAFYIDRDSYSDCESSLSAEDESDQHVIFTETNKRSNDGSLPGSKRKKKGNDEDRIKRWYVSI